MPNHIYKENLTGLFDGVSCPLLVPPGAISDGLNVRKDSIAGGWKARKGCALNNTTAAEGGAAINSLHQFTHPRKSDYHFIAQVNSKLLDATNDPPAAGTTFGADLGVTVGTTPGRSCEIREQWFFCDGSGAPIVYGGTTPFCRGFFVWDNSESDYVDYTKKVTDNLTTTCAYIGKSAYDVFFLITSEIAHAAILDLGDVNVTATTMKVYSRVAGAWEERSTGFNDGTKTGGDTTLGKDGTISWTRNPTDQMMVIAGMMGYVYKFEPQVALTTSGSGMVTVKECTVTQNASAITNKWNGIYEWLTGCKFFDQSVGNYVEKLGSISNESEYQYVDLDAATTSDFLYYKTLEPSGGIAFGIVPEYENSEAALIDAYEYWDGNAFSAASILSDTTKNTAGTASFAQSGLVLIDAANITPQRRTLEGDDIPGYWYRISWSAALSANTRAYIMLTCTFAEELQSYDGCIEYKGRLLLWGDSEYPNRLRYSAYYQPDCFSGADSGYTDACGGMDPILACVQFYNELFVIKKNSVWLLEGYSPATFGFLKISTSIGIASPASLQVIDMVAFTEEGDGKSIVIFQATDGVYKFNGRSIEKISYAIGNYFDPDHDDCIPANEITASTSFTDPINHEYHLVLSAVELVYNYAMNQWLPPFKREIVATCGCLLRGTDNRYYTYIGSSSGFVMRAETDTSDKSTANADIAIEQYVKSRAVGAAPDLTLTAQFSLRRLWMDLKTQLQGFVKTRLYKNMAVDYENMEKISMVSNTHEVTFPVVKNNQFKRIECFQVEFYSNEIDTELVIYGFGYEIDIKGYLTK